MEFRDISKAEIENHLAKIDKKFTRKLSVQELPNPKVAAIQRLHSNSETGDQWPENNKKKLRGKTASSKKTCLRRTEVFLRPGEIGRSKITVSAGGIGMEKCFEKEER